jgi:hypothetical protein
VEAASSWPEVPNAVVVTWTTGLFALGEMVAIAAVLLAIGLRNPRVMLQHYPKDVQAAVPPRQNRSAERRSGGASRY